MNALARNAGFLGFALATLAAPPAAFAQSYPVKPVRMVVPYPPGSSSVDIIGRIIAARAAEALAQPFVIDNRAGANGTIGSEHVARAPGDGYTLLLGTSSSHVISLFTTRNVPFHPVRDFTPVTMVGSGLTGLAVTPSLPVRDVSDLMRYARNNPGRLSYASNGVGSIYHLAGEMMKMLTGLDIVHVPYKGGAQMMPDLIAGQVQMSFASLISVLPQVHSAKVRLIAVLEPSRYAALPDVPALAEAIPEFRKPPTWLGLFGPAHLPGAVLARLNAALVTILKGDEVRAQLENNGFAVIANTPEQFAAAIRGDMDYVARIVKAAGIQPE